MPIRRATNDSRTEEQRKADVSALAAFEAGEFLADPEKEAEAVARANDRAAKK